MNFSEDRGVGIIYLPTKFQLHRFINNGDLLLDRNHWKDVQTHTEIYTRSIIGQESLERCTDTHRDIHT